MGKKDVHYVDPSRENGPPEYDDEAAAEYVSHLKPVQDEKKQKKTKRIIMIVVVVVLVVGAAAAYFLFFKSDNSAKQTPAPSSQTETVASPEEIGTKKYTSTELRLSLEYPANWKVKDDVQGLVTFTSPVVKIKENNGGEVDAKIVLGLVAAGSDVPGYENSNSATAVMDSEKITYANPSQNQRKQTYLSFAGFGSNGLDAIYVTGDFGYQKNQNIPKTDVQKIEPIIYVRFYLCNDNACEGEAGGPLSIDPAEWQTNQYVGLAKKTIESLRVE